MRNYLVPGVYAESGLGNVMFVLAATEAHAARVGSDVFLPDRMPDRMRHLWEFLGKPHRAIGVSSSTPIAWHEQQYHYVPIPATSNHGLVVGYFQSYKYFQDQEGVVRSLFSRLKQPMESGTVGVHIRRGDYLQQLDKYVPADKEFIQKALRKISPDINKLVLFSDDPAGALDILATVPEAKSLHVEVNMDTDPCLAMAHMTSMQELIMSASTFSWWGAWIGQPDRVYVPKDWFRTDELDYSDVCPEEWIKL